MRSKNARRHSARRCLVSSNRKPVPAPSGIVSAAPSLKKSSNRLSSLNCWRLSVPRYLSCSNALRAANAFKTAACARSARMPPCDRLPQAVTMPAASSNRYREICLDRRTARRFSFGFARGHQTTTSIGLSNPEYDKLLADNIQARIIFRITKNDGRISDGTSSGVSKDKALAELKALMNSIEGKNEIKPRATNNG